MTQPSLKHLIPTDGFPMRAELAESLRRYASARVELGGFLMAVLENDLVAAATRADNYNGASLPDLVRFCYAHLPAECWGSKEKVAAWLAR